MTLNKKKNIIVIGASGHAKVIIDIIEQNNEFQIIGLIDSFKSTKKKLLGYPILGKEEDLVTLSEKYDFKHAFIAIGDNWSRKKIREKISKIIPQLEFISVIHPNAIIGKDVTIGIGTVIMPGVIINCDSKIGDFCILNTNSSLDHEGVMKNYSSLAPNTTLGGNVSIGTCTAISIGANIIQDITIGKYSIIGAGSLVIRDIDNFTMAYGSPTKMIRKIKKGEKYLYHKNNTPKKPEEIETNKVKKNKIKESKPDEKTNNDYVTTSLPKNIEATNNQYILECYDLQSVKDLLDYEKNLTNFKGFDVFYKTELFNNNVSQKEKHKYFILKKEEDIIILMPFSLRTITINNKDTGYFDSTSFYGYSGPLYSDQIKEEILMIFWALVDEWYQKNNVVSEFIRFNLDGNHKQYSGRLVPTLSNVKGKIIKNKELQWDSYTPKVRNNYRKAQNNGLSSDFHQGSTINAKIIEKFYKIYISTMDRNMADSSYYFSLDYFKNLILSNLENCVLVIIHKESEAISTELILLNKECMYSFLGGTLSSYFDYRPNDFLKIEAMNWGRENNYKYYILGGGRADFDGLYKYKKSFFPKDEDVIYYTGRKIIIKEVYNVLVKESGVTTNNLLEEGYFPKYRQVLKNNML